MFVEVIMLAGIVSEGIRLCLWLILVSFQKITLVGSRGQFYIGEKGRKKIPNILLIVQ